MSSALDEFERSLVTASRALSAQRNRLPRARGAAAGRSWRSARRWLRSLGLAGQIGVAGTVGVTVAAAATASCLLLSGAPASRIPGYECQTSRHSAAVINPVTGNPRLDCAAAWPSATEGQSAAPSLTAWANPRRDLSAVVRATSLGRPGPGWQRLPSSWTLQLPLSILTDQLNELAGPFNRGCTSETAATETARRYLTADHLSGWTVTTRTGGFAAAACVPTTTDIDLGSRTIEIDRLQPAPASDRRETQATIAARHTRRQLIQLQAAANHALRHECVTAATAATIWKRRAARAGFTPTTLAYWRELNRTPATSRRVGSRYTLYRQPTNQQTGRCARILVIGSSEIPAVYAARITP